MNADSPRVGIAVTRGEGPAGPLTTILKEMGAQVLHWGSIAFAPPEDPAPLMRALGRLAEFDWILFTSPRAVEAVTERVRALPGELRTAVVGPSTGAALREAGWPVHLLPEEGSGEGMVEAFRASGACQGARMLFPASAVARETVPEGLAALGARVERVTAYRMVILPLDGPACEAAFEAGEVQAVTFASPSAMKGLKEGLGEPLFRRMAAELPAAVMGGTTAAALEEEGWGRIEVAEEPTLAELAAAAIRAASGPERNNS